MKVWVDMTASAHVLVFQPLIAILEERGDEVQITARDYAQTLQLLELHGLQAEVIGRHGGRSRVQKARQMAHRLGALRRWAKGRGFDVALALGITFQAIETCAGVMLGVAGTAVVSTPGTRLRRWSFALAGAAALLVAASVGIASVDLV